MRAFVTLSASLPPHVCERPRPAPGSEEVLIRIAACGLNFADLLLMEGRYQEQPDFPLIPGMEFAGTVEEAGPDTSLAVGTRVAVYSGHGGLAEFGSFAEHRCVPLPDNMSFEQAAGFLVAYGTSHLALDHRARLRPGETLLVLGAAGGVGRTAVEIGKQMGARVVACARGAEKLKIAALAGADHLIDSGTDDLRKEVLKLGGADVVYDPVGGDWFRAAFRSCNPQARILVIGFASGQVPPIA
ncbi:MAG: NADPH:quinone oxidoreductase family protein, partial [Halocynthiibacter sp.]